MEILLEEINDLYILGRKISAYRGWDQTDTTVYNDNLDETNYDFASKIIHLPTLKKEI